MLPRKLATLLIAAATLLIQSSAIAKHPNIVLILADDFGVGDIQAHYPNNKIPTPHLDKLVTEGMSFTDAHSPSAVCSPTRYALLTGRTAWRTRLQEWVIAAYEPPLIEEGRPTLPSYLKTHGYYTGWQDWSMLAISPAAPIEGTKEISGKEAIAFRSSFVGQKG